MDTQNKFKEDSIVQYYIRAGLTFGETDIDAKVIAIFSTGVSHQIFHVPP